MRVRDGGANDVPVLQGRDRRRRAEVPALRRVVPVTAAPPRVSCPSCPCEMPAEGPCPGCGYNPRGSAVGGAVPTPQKVPTPSRTWRILTTWISGVRMFGRCRGWADDRGCHLERATFVSVAGNLCGAHAGRPAAAAVGAPGDLAS